jgi:hypothetical protein
MRYLDVLMIWRQSRAFAMRAFLRFSFFAIWVVHDPQLSRSCREARVRRVEL